MINMAAMTSFHFNVAHGFISFHWRFVLDVFVVAVFWSSIFVFPVASGFTIYLFSFDMVICTS